jgi:putative ATP-grasp target RiPP
MDNPLGPSPHPWGLRHLTNYGPGATVRLPYSSTALDPNAQTTIYRDHTGQIVRLGTHKKTAPATQTREPTGGGDGSGPSGTGAPDQRPVTKTDED